MPGFRTFAFVVVAVLGLVVVAHRTRFGFRQAEARVERADLAPSSRRVLSEVLAVAVRPALPKLDNFIVRPDPDPDHVVFRDTEDSDGLTAEQRWEGTVAELEDRLAPGRGAFQGRVRDKQTNEDLGGVTIVVTSPMMDGAWTAISDEHGFFAIGNLPVGEYLMTFYYLETTVERAGMRIEAQRATPAFQSLEQVEPGEGFVLHGEDVIEQVEPSSDAEPDSDPDEEVSFTGVTSLENHYIVD